jgi:hypothetical protein
MEEEHIASRGGDQYVLALHWWDRSTKRLILSFPRVPN